MSKGGRDTSGTSGKKGHYRGRCNRLALGWGFIAPGRREALGCDLHAGQAVTVGATLWLLRQRSGLGSGGAGAGVGGSGPGRGGGASGPGGGGLRGDDDGLGSSAEVEAAGRQDGRGSGAVGAPVRRLRRVLPVGVGSGGRGGPVSYTHLTL